MSSLILHNPRFQNPAVLSCVFDYAVLCFLPLEHTSLITKELTFLATLHTYALFHCYKS